MSFQPASSDFGNHQTDRPISLRRDDSIPTPIEEASAFGGGHRNQDGALLCHTSLVNQTGSLIHRSSYQQKVNCHVEVVSTKIVTRVNSEFPRLLLVSKPNVLTDTTRKIIPLLFLQRRPAGSRSPFWPFPLPGVSLRFAPWGA